MRDLWQVPILKLPVWNTSTLASSTSTVLTHTKRVGSLISISHQLKPLADTLVTNNIGTKAEHMQLASSSSRLQHLYQPPSKGKRHNLHRLSQGREPRPHTWSHHTPADVNNTTLHTTPHGRLAARPSSTAFGIFRTETPCVAAGMSSYPRNTLATLRFRPVFCFVFKGAILKFEVPSQYGAKFCGESKRHEWWYLKAATSLNGELMDKTLRNADTRP